MVASSRQVENVCQEFSEGCEEPPLSARPGIRGATHSLRKETVVSKQRTLLTLNAQLGVVGGDAGSQQLPVKHAILALCRSKGVAEKSQRHH